jgi:phage gp29-like protein
MALLDQYGRQINKGMPIIGEVGVSGVRDRYSNYPSQGLTPERLTSILKEADQGDILRQAELFEEMEEKDAHLGSVLQTRKLAVAGLEWEVVAASGEKEDEDIAAFVREALTWVTNWDDALMDVLDAIGKGFSVMEIMWELAEGKVWVDELRWRHQKRFTFYCRDRILDVPRMITDAEPVYGEELIRNKFVLHRYRSRSGFVPRAGILRPCAWMHLFKNYTLKDWVVFNERFAQPMRVGKYSSGASEEERAVLRNAVFNLGADAAAVISESTVIEFLEQQGKRASSDLYERLADFCDRAISKAVLGQTLTTEQRSGSYATARVHQQVRQDLLEADSRALAATITMQLIRPLVEFNFGPEKNLPAFRLNHEPEENLRDLAQTYRNLSDMGLEIPRTFIHERFGIPMPEKGVE